MMGQNEGSTTLDPLDFSSKEGKAQAKKDIKTYINGPKEHPNNAVPCAAPVQLTMNQEKGPLPVHKNPDTVCNCITCCCCCARPGAVWFFMSFSLPTVIMAKYGLGNFAVMTITFCLGVSLLMRLLAICFPKCFEMNTPSLRDTFMNVIDIKRKDNMKMQEVSKQGMVAKAKYYFWKGFQYTKSMFLGFCCCRFFRPSVIFTFAKVLIAMMFTEVLMVVSAYLYFVARFLCGSLTWTLCSLSAWVREFNNSNAIKSRIVEMKYPAWGSQGIQKAKEDEKSEDSPDEKAKKALQDKAMEEGQKRTGGGAPSGGEAPSGGDCCQCCDADLCGLCCSISCPLALEMFSVLLDTFMELFSAIMLVGKA